MTMDGQYHPHDSRNGKCDAPGCRMAGCEAHTLKLNTGTTLYYCSDDCQRTHEIFLKRMLPELGVQA